MRFIIRLLLLSSFSLAQFLLCRVLLSFLSPFQGRRRKERTHILCNLNFFLVFFCCSLCTLFSVESINIFYMYTMQYLLFQREKKKKETKPQSIYPSKAYASDANFSCTREEKNPFRVPSSSGLIVFSFAIVARTAGEI